jgi:hypothetical protein
VVVHGHTFLDADVDRIGQVEALGLDETLFCRAGRPKNRHPGQRALNTDAPTSRGQAILTDDLAGRVPVNELLVEQEAEPSVSASAEAGRAVDSLS